MSHPLRRLSTWLVYAVSASLLILSGVSAAHAQSPACAFPIAYPGDAAAPEAIAAWMAARATSGGLPEELPVMAALVESSMQNLPNGDRDSVGFFQMRVGIWNQGPYAGYPSQPELQIKWFLDQATSVRNQPIAQGDRDFVDSPDGFDRWIDAALKSRRNRGSYQLKLEEARQLIAAGRLLAGSWPFAGAAPGDDAPRTTIAAWMASRARAAGLPRELPIMAALVESGLQNLRSDGSSAGYFRISEPIWNAGPYAGFPTNPELQVRWFIDQAVVAKARRIASGELFFGDDPSQYGEWIADVERPAEQFRGRYQLRLQEARSLMSEGCATVPPSR